MARNNFQEEQRIAENIFHFVVHPNDKRCRLEDFIVLPAGNEDDAASTGVDESVSLNDVGTILIRRVRAMGQRMEAEALNYFSACYRRAAELIASKSLSEELKKKVMDAQEELISYSILFLTLPVIYDSTSDFQESSNTLLRWIQKKKDLSYFIKMINKAAKDEEDALAPFIKFVATHLCTEISKLKLVHFDSAPLDRLATLSKNKIFARSIVNHENFLLFESNDAQAKPKISGWLLQEKSLLGHAFSLTPIDGGTSLKENERFHATVFGTPVLTTAHLLRSFKLYHGISDNINKLINEIIKNLCTADAECCDRVLSWFGIVLSSNQRRAMLGHRASLSGTPESLDPSYRFIRSLTQENTYGFSLNVFTALLLLGEPITGAKQASLDPFYILRKDPVSSLILGALQADAKLGDEDAVKRASNFVTESKALEGVPKFGTKIFWLLVRGLGVLFKPAMVEFMKLLPFIEQQKNDGGNTTPETIVKQRDECLTWHLVLFNPMFVDGLIHFIHMTATLILRVIYCYDEEGGPSAASVKLQEANTGRVAVLAHQGCCARLNKRNDIPQMVSPQFAILPDRIVEDLFDAIRQLITLNRLWKLNASLHHIRAPAYGFDCDILTALFYTVMLHPEYFRSVDTRCIGAEIFGFLYATSIFEDYFENSQMSKQLLIPSLAMTFIDSQKAEYFHRLQFRCPIVEIFLAALNSHTYRLQFSELANQHPDTFIHLIHFLLSDVSDLVEDAMSSLTEIRRRELEGRTSTAEESNGTSTTDVTATSQASNTTTQDAGSDDIENIVGELQGSMPFRSTDFPALQRHARVIVDLGFKTCLLFWTLSKHCGNAIIGTSSLVPHAVNCLNCCLDHLVGPECLKLKVQDFSKYNFDPKGWLSKICETYVFLVNADKEKGENFIREIFRDGRFYKPETFRKAYTVSRREGLLTTSSLAQFNEIVRKLLSMQDEDISDIPEEYLDPLMQELMTDPVRLPTSNIIMDRKHIERHLMSDPSDPFNRMKLNKEELIPIASLKEEIEKYIQSIKCKRQSTSGSSADLIPSSI